MLPERVRDLSVTVDGAAAGDLLHHSVYEFRYGRPTVDTAAPWVSLLMPPSRPTWQDGSLFPVMDQHLPEGDLYLRIRALFPKQPLSPMHLLALVGRNGIGRLGFGLPGGPSALERPPVLTRDTLRRTRWTPELFDELVRAYLGTGAGIAGIQPKVMVPVRPTVPIPTLIVKAASPAYPGLAANEFLCLTVARRAGLRTPGFELSDDGQLLLVDRFDLTDDGCRLGFEDIAALMGLRVRDVLADRKYQGSYERVAELLRMLRLPQASLARFFEQVALSVMLRNGDAHLKNFGVLYTSPDDPELAPVFDVVTTGIYRYARWDGGPPLEDHTLALKLFAGRHGSRVYPDADALLRFGRQVCGVPRPIDVIRRIATAMTETLVAAAQDERVPATLLQALRETWSLGLAYDSAAAP